MNTNIDNLSIATIRSLCIDMINKAKSGHPGMALGSAPILYTLYTKHLIANPNEPLWFNRDRFVLSSGHASSLLYALLHLSGYSLTIEDLRNFRQLGSITPGHPEYRLVPGVDATSGPLGQGIAQAVGMAMAERMVSHQYVHGSLLCSHYTYCLCGDGCLQEGLSQEAISFAGNQKLNKLILFYDKNDVTLDGPLSNTSNDDVRKRFESANWNVLEVKDGNNVSSIDQAIIMAKRSKDKPTVIIVHTIIGFGSANQGTSKVHGSPLGLEDGKAAKEVYSFIHPEFFVPEEVRAHFKETFVTRGKEAYASYQSDFVAYQEKNKVEAKRFYELVHNNNIRNYFPKEMMPIEEEIISTRKASQKALNDFYLNIPNLVGGSADVASSVCTKVTGGVDFMPRQRDGRVVNFGIREFAMASFANGMLLHGGVHPYVGCFLVFSDYMKPAIRMAALSKLPAIYLFSHDSIAVGEDGPTHQPIEQLAMLRSIPNVNVIRPCDEMETYASWHIALCSKETPTAIILSRQDLKNLKTTSLDGVKKGAYVVSESKKKAQYILLATGSEVSLAISAQEILDKQGIATKVVSMPSMYLFERQKKAYQDSVLDLDRSKIISVEMLSSFGWDKYAAHHMSVENFGMSGKASEVIDAYHFTVNDVVNFVKALEE